MPMNFWSMYSRPLFHYEYSLTPSDTIDILSKGMHDHLGKIIQHHKDQIRQTIEQRMDGLIKRYEENNKLQNRFVNFFKGNSVSDKNYVN